MRNKATVIVALIGIAILTLVMVHQNSTIQQQRGEIQALMTRHCG